MFVRLDEFLQGGNYLQSNLATNEVGDLLCQLCEGDGFCSGEENSLVIVTRLLKMYLC